MFRIAPWSLLVVLVLNFPALAQQRRTGGGGQGGDQAAPGGAQGEAQQGAQQRGLQQGVGLDLGITAEDAFAGGVERQGAVGTAATAAPGASALSPAGAATGGRAGGAGIRGGIGGFGGFGGFGGPGGFGGQTGGQFGRGGAEEPLIRTRLRSAVDVAPRPPEQVERRAARTLNRVSAPDRFPQVRVEMDGQTAVLSGAVDRREDRRMSALLMMLEPGVSNIDNRIRVRE